MNKTTDMILPTERQAQVIEAIPHYRYVSEISDELNMNTPNVANILAELRDKNIVESELDDEDRRKTKYKLTKAGRKVRKYAGQLSASYKGAIDE